MNNPTFNKNNRAVYGRTGKAALAVALLMSVPAFAQTPFFTPGNLVVSVEGNGVAGGPGSYGDNQAAPLTLFQYTPSGASSVSFVNSLVLPQTGSGANLPVSGEYGSSSEGTLHLSGIGHYLTIMGYGVNAAAFNSNSNSYSAAPNAALAQSSSLTGQSYTPIPRVVALIDAYGNVNSSTALFNIFDGNNPRSTYTADGMSIYVSGQGNSPDHTGGVFFTMLGGSSATPITGDDTNTNTSSQDTRDVQIYNNTLYVSVDSKEGSGSNRDFIGTLGTPPSTTLFNGGAGPTQLTGFGTSKAGKLTVTATNGNNLNSPSALRNINLSPVNYFFANATTLYVADSGVPKNDSNGDTNASGTANIGNGGLQKWVNTSGTWHLVYTLYQGLNLVNNGNTNGPGGVPSGTSGLYGLTGVVNGTGSDATVSLYATNYTLSDLDQTYLYGITDTLSNTTPPGTSLAFTLLDTAPPDSNFKGVSFAPAVPAGGVTITSSPSGLAFTSAGTGCAPGTYTTPVTLIWTPGNSCTLSVVPTQNGPTGVQYDFSQWEDGTTNPAAHTVISPATPATYSANFTTEYQLTTSAGTGGTVSAGGLIAAGTNATITATPSAGYYFVNFTGTATSTSNPFSLAMNGPQSITANFAPQVTPAINWPAPAAITYGTALSSAQLNATASVPGTFAYAPASGTVLPAGPQMLSVLFTPTDTIHYTTATASNSIAVNQATLTVTANSFSRPYGTPNPVLTAAITGFVNGDPASVVSGSPALSTTATASSLPGPYAITVGNETLTATNYAFNLVGGTLTVAFTALAPSSGSSCNGAYNGTFNGNLTVSAGQECIFMGGRVTGNIQQNGGNLTLIQSTIGGNLQIAGAGTFTIGPASTINGNLQIQNLPSSPATNQVCGTTVHGNLQFSNNATAVLLGAPSSLCPGNTIGGNLQVQNNSASALVDNNTIDGNLQVQNNTASTAVFNDSAKGNLQCSGDSAITGGGDTAAQKQGQCSAF